MLTHLARVQASNCIACATGKLSSAGSDEAADCEVRCVEWLHCFSCHRNRNMLIHPVRTGAATPGSGRFGSPACPTKTNIAVAVLGADNPLALAIP